jgi:rhodanese-related sulfurtransferase
MITQHKGRAFFLAVWLFFAAIVAGAANLPPSGKVDGPQGHALMNDLGERLLVLDVRTPEEFAQGHVPGALLISVLELEKRLGEIPGGRPVLLVCHTGRRVVIAYEILAKARPDMIRSGLWHLKATPEYKPDGNFVFR